MWVVKLGGSLHDAPALRALAARSSRPGRARRASSCPGGGPFADAVRAPAAGAWAFDDLAAHRMAILAMQQFGLALQALEPRLALAETEARAARGPGRGLAALAARGPRAGHRGRAGTSPRTASPAGSRPGWAPRRCVLVKSAPVARASEAAAELVAAGLLDPAFPRSRPGSRARSGSRIATTALVRGITTAVGCPVCGPPA